MSLALYRRYRPATLAEVIGQEHVTAPLRQALAGGRVHHAYLFSGPRGCGKTSTARVLARSLNCVDGPTPDPCGRCESCQALAPGGTGSLDVIEIDAASHGGVDDARELRERAFFAPVSSPCKVYIIDEAHMVTREGFNALLRVVEEPPPHVTFVFATTEPEKVISTIRSRTFHYPFRLVPPGLLREHLAAVCGAEGATVDQHALALVVRAAAGSVRDALSLLDQLLAGCGPEGLTYQAATALLGQTDATLLDEMVEALAAGDGATVFRAVDRMVEAGHDPRRFASDLLDRCRDLLLLAAVPDAADSGLLDAPVDQLERMHGQAARFGTAGLTRAAEVLHAGLTEMRGTTSPRLLLELMCARLLLPAAGADDPAVLARLDRLERRFAIAGGTGTASGGAGGPAADPGGSTSTTAEPAATSPPPAIDLTGPPAAAAPGPRPGSAVGGLLGDADQAPTAPAGVDLDQLRRMWPEVMEAVKGRKRTPHALLLGARLVDVTGGALVLEFTRESLARKFVDPLNADVLRGVLHDLLGVDWAVRATSVGPAEAAGAGFAPGDGPGEDLPAEPTGDREERAVALLEGQLGARLITDDDG